MSLMLEKTPPKFTTRLLLRFLRSDLAEEVRGDLEEKFHLDLKNKSAFKAKLNYWYQVINYLRPFAIRKSRLINLNNYDMFQSYFKIGWRNLLHNKGFSFINIFGLSIGMTACVLIMLYVFDESGYDKHHKNGDRVFRIAGEVKGDRSAAAAAPIAEGLKKDFPEVEQSSRLLKFPGADKVLLKDDKSQKQFFEINGFYVDSTFFQIFTYDLKYGDKNTALNGLNSIVISEQVADKFFANENPVDHVLKVTLPFGDFNYTIKGVFRNTHKSHIPANLLLSMNNGDVGGWVKSQTNWATNNIFHTYVKLKDGTNPKSFESKLDEFINRNGSEDLKAAGFTKTLFIQPLEDIYLHSDFGYEIAANGSIKYLYIFTSIAAFLLLIACINFMNLSTARSERRAKEVGLRKVIGAAKGSLVSQFLMESLLMSVLALLFACLLIQLSIPIFNQLINKQLSLLQFPNVYTWLLVLTIATGFLAGLYPAFYLSSFKPVTTLKGKLTNAISAVSIRKGLVVFQFTISIVLILGATFINRQMTFLSSENLGFDKNQKIVLPIQTSEANKNAGALKTKLLNIPQVVSVAHAGTYPGIENIQDMLFYAEDKTVSEIVDITMANVGDDYAETLGIKILQGRTFSKEFTNDTSALVLNEAAVKDLGYTINSAVGKNVYFEWRGKKFSMNVIGVVKDYHYQSLHQKVKPLALTISPWFSTPNSYFVMSVKSNNYAELIASFEKVWSKINADSPFAYSFLDEDFQKNYEKEERTLSLMRYFTGIAIVIACLGLFGLSSFTAEQRVKEIGVRKVLGASISEVVVLLSTDFLKLVLISIVLASPIGYYLMDKWLQGFAYHITISWWVFIIVGLVAILVALLTISFQAIKAAMANPVNSLKAE